jgi:hypothetical protein
MTHKVAHRMSMSWTLFWPIICPLVTQHKYRVVQAEIVSCTVRKKFHMNMYLILKGYWDTSVWISRPNSIRFLFVVLDEERSLQKKAGYGRQIGHSHFRCCCLHKAMWTSTQTNNMRSSHTSYKEHWGWQWDFRTFIVNCNKFVISVQNMSFKH